jgi:type IV pilus assembly protein PilY1
MTYASRGDRIRSWRALAAALLLTMAGPTLAQIVTQTPLSAGGNVPGNLLLVPSVEWPTIDSMANIEPSYSTASEYVGYFDSNKCYKYNYSSTETDRYFYPVTPAASHVCSQSNKEWSGNFLNWAATQTIDPFRKALTGGYRTTDTNSVTILEKARSDDNTGASIYPDRRLPNSGDNNGMVKGATPANWDHINTRLRTFGNRMRFSSDGDVGGGTITPYDPATGLDGGNRNTIFEVSVRVKVCVSGMLEENCVAYGGNAKPEGLIQKYSDRIRYSAFGYLNDHDMLRDGGVLRARQKFVAPMKPNPVTGIPETNPNREWRTSTGILIQNPDSADASATSAGLPITDSGVINYINKFGQMTTKSHKAYDPVSELYYTALRYLRNLPNVPAYTDLGSGSATNKYELADGFPVITTWDDPLQYWCQNSAILGIGDVNTHRDKDLKGTTRTVEEPAMPGEVSGDTIDVDAWTQKIATLEGFAINTPFSGRENSAYIAGLAYWAHTQDLRPGTDLLTKNKQTVSTHWVDVREAQVLQPRTANQYWLAAKYGGFTLPKDYDSLTNVTPLDDDTWYTNGEDLDPGAPLYKRADNFYVASDAENMVDSLTRAFAKIGSERVGSGASLAANSTRLDTQTRTFQAQFRNLNFGQINSFSVASDGSLSAEPIWTAGTPIEDGTGPVTPGVSVKRINAAARNIWVNAGGTHKSFIDSNLTATQQGLLTFVGKPTSGPRATTSADIVDYLRGSIAREESEKNGSLRVRNIPETGWSPILGDIVNSTPVFVGAPSTTLYSGATFTGAGAYGAFAAAQASRLGVVYVGGNDGMLHSFNAANGKEVYAFIPNASFLNNKLGEFASPNFDHKYLVDGDVAVADVYVGSAWKTVLVGTMGRGGPGVFALDITNPLSPTFLWEKGTAEISALGRNIGRPVIAQVANGDWRVVFGNGVDNAGAATLVLITLDSTGTVSSKSTGVAGTNGLSAALVRDNDANGFAETAYAGDLKGNMWKFANLSGTTTITSMFIAKDPTNAVQPITAAPLVGVDPSTSITWVFFGTGRYLHSSDLTNLQRQTWYGIKDTGTVPTRATMVARAFTDVAGRTGTDFTTVRTLTQGTVGELASTAGWYIDLPVSGERIVVPNRFQGGALIGTSRIPALVDVCQPTGRGYVMAIDPFTGGRLPETFFDTNHDGKFDASDTAPDGTLLSGIGFDSSANNPIFIENVMQVGLDDGSTKTVRTQGTNVDASRMSWREILN